MTKDQRPTTKDPEPSTCPRCGKQFSCSKSGKCWCYEIHLTDKKLEEVQRLYDSCLCPACLKEFAEPRQK